MIGIYKITNLSNNKIYIGQSINIAARWEEHLYWSSNSECPIHRALRKYGVNKFSFEIIEECPKEELDTREIYWIKYYNSLSPNGYNLTPGGNQTHLYLKVNNQDIVDDYLQTKSIYKTANNLGIHRHTVSKILDEFNIKKQNVVCKDVVMINTKTLEVEKEFPSIVDAADYVGVSESAIRKALKDTCRTSKGHYWCLLENFDSNLFVRK